MGNKEKPSQTQHNYVSCFHLFAVSKATSFRWVTTILECCWVIVTLVYMLGPIVRFKLKMNPTSVRFLILD